MKKPLLIFPFFTLTPVLNTVNSINIKIRDQNTFLDRIFNPEKYKEDLVHFNLKSFDEYFGVNGIDESTQNKITKFYYDINSENLTDYVLTEMDDLDMRSLVVFKSIGELEKFLSFNKIKHIDLSSFLNRIDDYEVNREIMRFFGMLTSVYSPKLVNKLIGIIDLHFLWPELHFNFAYASLDKETMTTYIRLVGEDLFSYELNSSFYDIFMATAYSKIYTFVHEMGHVFSLFSILNKEEKERVNKFNVLTFDQIRQGYPDELTEERSDLMGGSHLYSWLNKNYLYKFANEYEKHLAAYVLVPSFYGAYNSYPDIKSKHFDEYFAEAFAYWLLTPKEQRNGSWQIMHKYFTTAYKDHAMKYLNEVH